MVWSFNKTHIFLWWTHVWWNLRSVAAGLPSSMWPSPILSLQHLAAPNKRRSDGWSDRQAALFASMTIDFSDPNSVFQCISCNIYIYCDVYVYIYIMWCVYINRLSVVCTRVLYNPLRFSTNIYLSSIPFQHFRIGSIPSRSRMSLTNPWAVHYSDRNHESNLQNGREQKLIDRHAKSWTCNSSLTCSGHATTRAKTVRDRHATALLAAKPARIWRLERVL